MKIDCSYDALVPVKSLKEKRNPRNPKRHPPEQIRAFQEIIKHQGIRRPIVVSNLSGLIVAGHGLLEALEGLEVNEAPVDYQEFATEADEIAHMIADNTLAEYGVTNDAQLEALLRQLEDEGLSRAIAGIIGEVSEEVKEEKKEAPGLYELQPEFDEGYDAVLIFTKTGMEWAQLATIMDLPRTMDRKGGIGMTRVIRYKDFLKRWNSRSSFPVTAEQEVLQPTKPSPAP